MLRQKSESDKKKLRLRRVFEMRRAGIYPVQVGADLWRVASLSIPGTTHTIRVWQAREFEHVDSIGASLDATCSCPARGECKHILAVRLEYNRDSRLLFELEQAVAA
jgi:hypothetical protein